MSNNRLVVLGFSLALAVTAALIGCTPATSPTPAGQMANPASVNCLDQGGTLEIETRADGGQYGVCLFEDNRQCEEWALFNGDCPVGGIKVTGFVTDAARFCAITGGSYTVTGNPNTPDEQGTCTFKSGAICDAWDFYNGVCTADTGSPAPTAAAGTTIQPLIMELCDGEAQAMSHTLDDLIPTQSEEPLSDPVSGATGTGCQSTITGTGAQFESPDAVVRALGAMLADEGWTEDPMLAAGGPTGAGAGYRKDDQLCLVNARWEPDPSASCPADQPISACPVTPEQQLYTVTLNCGAETGATSPSTSALRPVVFSSDRAGAGYQGIYLLSRAGGEAANLLTAESNFFAGPWSPDGQKILFTGFGPTNSYVGVMNADGTGQTALSQPPDSDEGFPAWSSDGTQIAFTSRRDGNNEIYVMNADGSNPTRLTTAPGDDFAPTWSPDGSQIAFASDRDRTTGVYSLYVMNRDGSAVKRLTNAEGSDDWPAWSPDGARIAFRSFHDGQADIFVIDVDGGNRLPLTQDQGDNGSPSWSPDAAQLVFQTHRDGNWEIYSMNADGSEPRNLTADPSDDQYPHLSP
jgi:TolB protein